MKKLISALISAAIGATALVPFAAAAEESGSGIVLLGDSIAAGYTRKGYIEHNYGEICGDYLGCNVYNYAKPGDTTDDLLSKLGSFTAEQSKNLADAEYVVISVGGNDILGYIAKYMLNYAEQNNYFKDGYSAKDVPASPKITDLTTMLDVDKLKSELQGSYSAAITFGDKLSTLSEEICGKYDKKTKTYSGGYIGTHVMDNIQNAADTIKESNPNAKVYVQTIFQPVQIEPEYINAKYGKGSNYSLMLNVVRMELENIMKSYSDQLSNVSDIDVVDVWEQFTSTEDTLSASNPGHASYFVDIKADQLSDIDIHPNQKGNVAIAAAILEKIGDLHDDTGLLSSIFESFSDKDSYPEIALATYKKVAGDAKQSAEQSAKLGDINSDGFVDAVDASSVLAEYTKRATSDNGNFTDEQSKLADVDVNGIVDAVDASKILAYYAYLSSNSGETKSIEEFIKTL